MSALKTRGIRHPSQLRRSIAETSISLYAICVFQLDQVVPWGRSFDEYCRMFALGDEDLSRRILGCGDGPASFNADATRRGSTVVSCDPIYRFEAADIRRRIATTREHILEQARLNASDYVWDSIRSLD